MDEGGISCQPQNVLPPQLSPDNNTFLLAIIYISLKFLCVWRLEGKSEHTLALVEHPLLETVVKERVY